MTEQNATQEAPVFRMQKMYIKDFSFENPNAPQIFIARNQEPKVDFNLQVNSKKIDEDHWEVSLAITSKMMDKNTDDQTRRTCSESVGSRLPPHAVSFYSADNQSSLSRWRIYAFPDGAY